MEKGNPCVWQNLLGIWQITCGKYGGISQSKIPSLNPIIIGGIVQISRAGEIPFAARQQRHLYQSSNKSRRRRPSIQVSLSEWFSDFVIYHLSV
ncbi:hypothetical protein Pyn_09435 [Prunus yedoensis var. nudiflora]|uniref:Uncharacterized protein n=1 Tax=Prunus yedoensis var. nudiflora TaxID=2094558 RepID=A0A314YAR6_PRUYE|nr:hypothetical protein Pyn_09435 [Prunus yedoensis var. nudiflora]